MQCTAWDDVLLACGRHHRPLIVPLNGTFAVSEMRPPRGALFRQRRAEWTSLGVDHSGHVSRPAFLAASPSSAH